MQQLSSVSLTSEIQSETVQKGVKGATYDPLSETLFAIVQGNQSKSAASMLVQIPDKAQDEEQKLSSSQPQLANPKELQTSSLKSLVQTQSERRVIVSEANPKGLSQYLQPYLLADSRADVREHSLQAKVAITDTYHEPDCLRFCPSNSSGSVEISFSGFTVVAKLQSQTARANKAFSEGVHYWEIICPISCQTLQIGVSNKNQKEEVVQQFRTTTPRIIGIELNLDKLTLNFWLNGRYLKERAKKVSAGHVWYPTVKFKEPEYFVIINPFAQGKGDVFEENNPNHLPLTLRSSEIQLLNLYLTTKLKGMLVVFGLNQEIDNDVDDKLKKLLRLDGSVEYQFRDKYELLWQEQQESEQKPDSKVIKSVLIRFTNYHDSVQYYHKNKDLMILYDKMIATMIQMRNSKEKVGDGPHELGTTLYELLLSKVFNQDDIQQTFLVNTGLSANNTVSHLSTKLSKLRDSIKNNEQQQQVQEIINNEQEKDVNETLIQYLENQDKMLLVNGSQLKLISRSGSDFNMDNNASFTGYPQKPEDKISLKLSKHEIEFMIQHLDWNQIKPEVFDILSEFIENLNTQNNNSVKITYQVAFVIVKSLLNIAINQYEHLENQLLIIQDLDITQVKNAQQRLPRDPKPLFNNEIQLPFEYGKLSLVDANQLLAILLRLEDQLWAVTQSDQVSSSLKSLWTTGASSTSSRLHTAFGRLSSLVTYPTQTDSTYDPIYLAELGLINTDDKYGKLQFYQDFKVELESIFERSTLGQTSEIDIRNSLERQFPSNIMLKGLPTWNVHISDTVNSMPPMVHENNLCDLKQNQSKVDSFKTLNNSDFIMTGSKDGSINIWSSKIKLQKIGGLNLKLKLHTDNEIDQLLFANMSSQEEEKKADQIGCNVKILSKKGSKIKVVKEAKQVEEEITEDLLFTMFNEADVPEEVEIDKQSETDDQHLEVIQKFLLDYADTPLIQGQKEKDKQKEEKKQPVEEEKKIDPNEETKSARKDSDKPVTPSQELLNQMVMMGFGLEASKLALLKSKNESLSAALDLYQESLDELNKDKKAEFTVTYKINSYECETCTLINPEGKGICEACGTAAPQTAYVEVKSESQVQKEKELEELKKKEQEDLILRLQEEEKQRLLEEQQRIEKEQEEKRRQEDMRRQTVEYYEKTEILDFIFASVNQGKSVKPMLTGAVLKNNISNTIEIEVHSLNYRQSYLRQFIGNPGKYTCRVCDIPHKTEEQALTHLFSSHQSLVESLYPTMIGNQLMQNNWSVKTNRFNQTIVRNELLGRIVFPFEKLVDFVQIGTDISKDSSIYFVGAGYKTGQSTVSVIIERIDFNNETNEFAFVTISDDSQLFKQVGAQNEDIIRLIYCQKSKKLVVLSQAAQSKQVVQIYGVDTSEKKLHLQRFDQFNLQSESEQLLKVENGVVYINVSDNKLRRYLIDESSIRLLHDKTSIASSQNQNQRNDALTEEEVLTQQINPHEVTIQDIQRYEKLMNGKTVQAISNSSQQLMSNHGNQKSVHHTNHHWVINDPHSFGPFEMKFQKPTSLISLNIELTFNANDSTQLLELLQNSQDVSESNSQKLQPSMIDTSVTEKKSENTVNLGLLSIQGISHESANNNQVNQHHQGKQEGQDQAGEQNFMPLVVNHHKGAAYNQSYQVCRVVTDNNLIFASNYPKPEFYFKHLHGHKMSIEKFTIRSSTNSKCGAYPIGSGIIFISDNLQAFEHTIPFNKFNLQDYNDWKQQRLKDSRPLQPYEPVAYFEFENETSITVDIDFQRNCKYIMLKPTGFRKKPTLFAQNINNVPMELEFFGVTGNSYEDNNIDLSGSNKSITSSQSQKQIFSNYELDLKVLNSDQTLKTQSNIEVQSIQGFDLQISGLTLAKMSQNDIKNVKLVAKTTLKLTDSHLQLQHIPGLSLILKNLKIDNNLFELRGVSIQGIVAEEDTHLLDQQRSIFNQTNIPVSYMRSCLLSPRYFNIINKVLAQMTSDEQYNQQLRMTIIQFLNKLMKIDREFAQLIYNEIDLAKFLQLNLFSGDNTGIQLTVEFLQNFQRDFEFINKLFNLLIQQVESLPENFISYSGYEALIGLLIWSVPLNPERTVQTLLQTLYSKICQQKIPQLQTKEAITFRTRQNINSYPFDLVSFKNHKQNHNAAVRKESIDQSHQLVAQESSNKIILSVEEIRKLKYDHHHFYDVKFKRETQITDIKLFFANQEQLQFKLIVKIIASNGQVIYYNTFDEQIFAQFASMAYQKLGASIPSDECLHLNNINYTGLGFSIMIEFGLSNSSLPKGSKNKPPDTMIEVYGSCFDLSINQAKIKEEIDKKAQEFWQSGAKLIKIGKAMQMLQITKSVDEFLIVPQVSSISTLHQANTNINTNNIISGSTSQINSASNSQTLMNINHLAANKQNELILLQEELKGKIRANDPNIKELVEKIQHIQHSTLGYIAQEHTQKDGVVQSLEFYMVLTSDFTKIIRNLVKNKTVSRDTLQQIIRDLNPSGDLSNIAFDLFEKYIAYDSGVIRQDIQEFISVCLNPLMTQGEIRQFSFHVIEEFLSKPHSNFSQKAVLEALTYLGIPEGELVSFLIQKLGINLDLKQLQNPSLNKQNSQGLFPDNMQPFVFMSSVLMLVLSQLKQIIIPIPGQTYHKGVKCSGCNAKMILGWRYKCGHCVQDMNFDSACMEKHLLEYPDHVMLVIKDPLEELSKQQIKQIRATQNKLIKHAILHPFKFKEQAPVDAQTNAQKDSIHENIGCDNCAKKPIEGKLYKCLNCEEYNLCTECFSSNKNIHHQTHIYAEIRKPLEINEQNPTMLMQVLDPRLYPETYKQQEPESPTKLNRKDSIAENQKQEDDQDDFEDLVPLGIARSLSQPTPLKKNLQNKNVLKKQVSINDVYEKLDYDQQFIVMFQTCVWVSQDIKNVFSKQEKIVLMKLTIETMLHLIKLTNITHIQSVISNKDAFFQILVSILQLNSRDLIQLFKNLFDLIRQPPSAIWIPNLPDQVDLSLMKKSEVQDQHKAVISLLEVLVSHLQNFLKWMIDLALQPDIAKLHSQQSHQSWALLLKSYQNQKVWLEHLQLIVELFIKTTDEIKNNQIQKQGNDKQANGTLEKIPEAQNENDDEDLVPLNMARSISQPLKKQGIQVLSQNNSLHIIKNMVQLLYISESHYSPQKVQRPQASHFVETESQTKYLSHMWSLVLKSLTSVNVNQLIEAKIFDSLVNAFLISTEEIKQITFPQILAITETIAKQSVNSNDISKFICNLLFLTLDNVTGNHHEKVGYSICQGWLDILISSSVARSGSYETNKTVYAKMSNDEISLFLKKTSLYLINYLNKGSFEGVTGAQPEIVMRLNLASDLLYVIVNAESKDQPGQKAISEFFKGLENNQKTKKEYQDSISNMIAWLFLNSRQSKDDIPVSQLGNATSLTPATSKVKLITEHIEELFQTLGDNGEHAEEAIRIALYSLTNIAKKMNKTLLDLSQTNSLGFEMSVKLSDRTNEYFIKLLSLWLVNDQVASYFVFDLNGFEFLLDTIGIHSEGENNLTKLGQTKMEIELVEQIENDVNFARQSHALSSQDDKFEMNGSDLVYYLESNLQEFQQNPISAIQGDSIDQANLVTTLYDNTKQLYVQEFSKSISMVDNNGLDPISSYQKTDWSVNKRAYKHRVIVKHLTGSLRSEYWLLFQLPHEVELREIQIAFNNYWGADTEVYAEPLSVLVEAGMDEKNLSLVCNLQIVKDDAFGSVSATVFGSNLQTFSSNVENIQSQIQDIIQQKLQSIQNFKIKYIKFCMRRSVITCLENSPLAIKFTKQVAFGINYISLLGYDLTKVGDYISYIKQEQKKTALEVLSIICSGDFKNILKVIAQQPKTIEKMKQSFNMLASLVTIKENLIEPTFIAISTYNNEMGDWIINQLLRSPSLNKHASLIGQIILCNKTELPRRLKLLQDHVMSNLRQIVLEDRSTHATSIKKLIPYIQIFIETLRIAAPDIQISTPSVDLAIKESYMNDIVNLLSTSTQEREQQTKILVQLLVLLLCPPQPFINSQVDIYEFTVKNLIDNSLISQHNELIEIQLQKENLASILSATKTLIAQEILRKGLNLKQLLKLELAGEDIDQSHQHFQHCIKFWINVSQDNEVRKSLAKDKIPLKLYENLRQDHPEQNNKIIRKDNQIGEQELSLMIELIKQLTAGTENLEGELAKLLMQDLEHLSKIRDMDFVNKVFLPLLRTERTIPVCLWPFDSENNKWITNYKPLNANESKNVQNQSSQHNNFVPSQLLQGEKRSSFIKNFKEVLGQHSKTNVKKLLSSNWTLAHSQTEQGSVSQFQSFWKNIENKAPVVILISGTSQSGNNVTYGCYSAKGIPAMPANLAQDSDYPVASSPEDFVFCYIDEHSFHHFAPKPSVPIISMFTDYEGGGAISVANDFMLMSYSYDFVFTVGISYDIEKILTENNPKPEKEVENTVNFLKFEIWTTDLAKQPTMTLQPSTSNIQIPAPLPQPNKQPQKPGDQNDIISQVHILQNEVRHPWFNNLNPYINYRSNPVFMIPAHLTLNQLSKIMLQSSVTFKARVGQNYIVQSSETLNELYQQILDNQNLYETQNGIIDLEYEINQLLGSQEEIKEEEQQIEGDSNNQLISGYVPKMGLFEQFETKGGVKLIISVTLQSMKLWKSEEQAKSWELWLKELESFSEIPLFFQLFLKNSKCKDLLFKVLAGQPDQEINATSKADAGAQAKWEEEQKQAVQFNYKILSEAFSISDDLKLREIGIKCGLLPTILERLGAISGEKPRILEEQPEQVEEEKKETKEQPAQMLQLDKTDRKKRKGVGYSSKVGQTFNVTQYLENKKLRNDQIKNLVDICSNFINSKEWKAGEEVMDIILESALLPLLESAFRNGSWLDMAKEYEVYHSYLALTRAIASQKNLVKCLSEIDPRYKPQQTDPIYRLLSKLNDLAEIFINCLNQQQKSEHVNKNQNQLNTLNPHTPAKITNLNNQLPYYFENQNQFTFSLPATQSSNQIQQLNYQNQQQQQQQQQNVILSPPIQNFPSHPLNFLHHYQMDNDDIYDEMIQAQQPTFSFMNQNLQQQQQQQQLPDDILQHINSFIPQQYQQQNSQENNKLQLKPANLLTDPLFLPSSQMGGMNDLGMDMLSSSYLNKPSTPPNENDDYNYDNDFDSQESDSYEIQTLLYENKNLKQKLKQQQQNVNKDYHSVSNATLTTTEKFSSTVDKNKKSSSTTGSYLTDQISGLLQQQKQESNKYSGTDTFQNVKKTLKDIFSDDHIEEDEEEDEEFKSENSDKQEDQNENLDLFDVSIPKTKLTQIDEQLQKLQEFDPYDLDQYLVKIPKLQPTSNNTVSPSKLDKYLTQLDKDLKTHTETTYQTSQNIQENSDMIQKTKQDLNQIQQKLDHMLKETSKKSYIKQQKNKKSSLSNSDYDESNSDDNSDDRSYETLSEHTIKSQESKDDKSYDEEEQKLYDSENDDHVSEPNSLYQELKYKKLKKLNAKLAQLTTKLAQINTKNALSTTHSHHKPIITHPKLKHHKTSSSKKLFHHTIHQQQVIEKQLQKTQEEISKLIKQESSSNNSQEHSYYKDSEENDDDKSKNSSIDDESQDKSESDYYVESNSDSNTSSKKLKPKQKDQQQLKIIEEKIQNFKAKQENKKQKGFYIQSLALNQTKKQLQEKQKLLNKQKTTTLFKDLKKIKVGKPLSKIIDKIDTNSENDSDSDEEIHYYDEDYDNLDSDDQEDSDVPDLIGGQSDKVVPVIYDNKAPGLNTSSSNEGDDSGSDSNSKSSSSNKSASDSYYSYGKDSNSSQNSNSDDSDNSNDDSESGSDDSDADDSGSDISDNLDNYSSSDSQMSQEEQKGNGNQKGLGTKRDTGLMDSEIPESLARDVIKTNKIVQAAVSKLLKSQKDEHFVENALNLPTPQAYKALLQDLRFDYMEMRDPADQTGQQFKHHYNTIAQQNQNPPASKMVRLAQELADLSNALPYEHTNAIFVRVDSQRVDMMKALICGASNTPYAHGCYEYDIFCDNNYPREPPKMNLITTGNGSVRFNPNLYACGKVCLSLLGTWRGSATENWDPKLSTILQVLLSTQAIIMSEEVYFNEPGFENEAGTPEGEKKNEGYQNIVRYCNIKFAMIEQIKRPAKGFESAVKRHFYIKKAEILKEVHEWLDAAEKNEATYGGLVNDHNYTWANQFKASKTKYKEMLTAAVTTLEDELNKLERPTDYELKMQSDLKKRQQQAKNKKKRQGNIAEGKEDLDQINVDYDEDDNDNNNNKDKQQDNEQDSTQINTDTNIDITDEKVKDRWSRYIGAMGVEAVAKQANANIFLSGAGALGIEIAKNLVLSGCKSFTMHDNKPITMRDMSGQFFINYEEDVLNKKKATRGEACMPRLKQLNFYVKCQLAPVTNIPLDIDTITKAPWNFHLMDVIILTECTYQEITFLNEYCRQTNKKLIVADAYGVFTRVFNDFGDKFEVLDTTGEELLDCMIKNISNEEEGLVELLPNTKHKLQDGDEVVFSKVQGMELIPGATHQEPFEKCTSINDTIHKVKVLTPYSFRIGNTNIYTKYQTNGLVKQLKTKKQMIFKSFKDTMLSEAQVPQDENLQYADFEKIQNNQIAHICFEALDQFKSQHNGQAPGSWNKKDADKFIEIAKQIAKRYPDIKLDDWTTDSFEIKFLYLFSFTNQGVFNPLCAFLGGFVAQECVKAITQKFVPTNQVFYYDALEVLPTFDPKTDFEGDKNDNSTYFEDIYLKTVAKTQEIGHRSDGLRVLVGADLVEKLAYTRLFMVGAGAIGCELLKNYAMLGVGVGRANPGKKQLGGSIVLTDPDVIEVSNLNRQFLFREKHLRNPKSSTAAAAAIYMNKELKENIIARLDKVHEGTSHIYTDQFFEDLTVVTNALDNVHARRYIDTRCVTAKTALLESGTLGPKGHVQVILPFLTESYGSQQDPEDNTEIPHCTLKMFPEETLHCVEWARDKFSKIFSQSIQNTIKVLDEGKNFQPTSQQDTMSLKQSLKIIEKRPLNFEDCIEYARFKFEKFFNHDPKQLLHVYPLDAKTKDGNLFWSLPKRPPVPVDFDPTNPLHCLFVSSFACLRANTFKVPIPDANPRSEQFRLLVGLKANSIKVPEFVPNDEKAKEIQASVQKETKEEEKKESEETKENQEEKIDPNDMEALLKKFQKVIEVLPYNKEGKINTEELLKPELFEKDNDANFHIDFIYAMANCRSTNYKLDPMDWITVKLKAGRIVPALSTTTSCVAGLQTLELVKLLKGCKKVDFRNIFMNMAVPFMQASEPADVMKTKLTDQIEVNLWTRWDVNLGKEVTLQKVIDNLQQQYTGLEIRDVLRGNAPLYFHAIMNAPGKEQEKQKILQSKVYDLVGADSDDKYVDIAVTCVRKIEPKNEEEIEQIDTSIKQEDEENKGEQILSGVPPVRIHFE